MRIILVRSVSTVKRIRVSLGTLVAIEATADSTAHAEAAIETAFAAVSQVNDRMHPHSAGSDLARINESPLHLPVKVHQSVGQLLNFARGLNELTEGVFDPCLPTQPGRLSDVHVSDDESEVVCHAPLVLDFGGFAKGYAVDCALEALMAAGCTAGLVNAGGDLRVFGPRAEPVFVRGHAGELTNIELADAALAVSDAGSQQRPPEHQGYYVRSIGDTRTAVPAGVPPGPPRDAFRAAPQAAFHSAPHAAPYAAVIASTATVADALTKCVLLCTQLISSRALRAFDARQP